MNIGNYVKLAALGTGAAAVGSGIGYGAGQTYDHNPFIGKAAIATTGTIGVGAVGVGALATLESTGVDEIVHDAEGRHWVGVALLGAGLIGGIMLSAFDSPALPVEHRTRVDQG